MNFQLQLHTEQASQQQARAEVEMLQKDRSHDEATVQTLLVDKQQFSVSGFEWSKKKKKKKKKKSKVSNRVKGVTFEFNLTLISA